MTELDKVLLVWAETQLTNDTRWAVESGLRDWCVFRKLHRPPVNLDAPSLDYAFIQTQFN